MAAILILVVVMQHSWIKFRNLANSVYPVSQSAASVTASSHQQITADSYSN